MFSDTGNAFGTSLHGGHGHRPKWRVIRAMGPSALWRYPGREPHGRKKRWSVHAEPTAAETFHLDWLFFMITIRYSTREAKKFLRVHYRTG